MPRPYCRGLDTVGNSEAAGSATVTDTTLQLMLLTVEQHQRGYRDADRYRAAAKGIGARLKISGHGRDIVPRLNTLTRLDTGLPLDTGPRLDTGYQAAAQLPTSLLTLEQRFGSALRSKEN